MIEYLSPRNVGRGIHRSPGRISKWLLALSLCHGLAQVVEVSAGDAIRADELMRGFPPSGPAVVHAGNWRTAPYSQWAFQHLEQIVPTRTVYRGTGPVSVLAGAESAARKRFQDRLAEQQFDLSAFMIDNHVDGLLVLKNGQVLEERYGNAQRDSTRHIMMSVGKSVVGTVAELLIAEGALDAGQRVVQYVPELSGSAFGSASVRQLLDMLVGVDYSEDMDDPYSDVNQFLYAAGLGTPPPGVAVQPTLYDFLRTLGPAGEHGETFHYVTPVSEVLGWVIARATNRSWVEIFEERIYQSLGPERDAFVIVDDAGTATAAGGLAMTLRDVGRFALMMSRDGEFNGRQILPEEVVKAIKAGGDPALWPPQDWTEGVNSYRSQWWIDHSKQTLRAIGIHGQLIQIDLKGDLVVVIQSAWPSAGAPEYWQRRDAFWEAARRAAG